MTSFTPERALQLLPYACMEWGIDFEYASDADFERLDHILNNTLVDPEQRLAFTQAIQAVRTERESNPPKQLTIVARAKRQWTFRMLREAEQKRLRQIVLGDPDSSQQS